MGLLTASAADLAKLRQAIDAVPRLEQLIAAVNSKTNKAFPSVWVKPTAAPSSGVHDGVFIEWNNTTSAWDSTGITCKIRERANGRLVVGKPYLGRTVGKTTDRVPIIQVVSSAGETSSDCSDVLGLIRAGKCLRMTIAGTPTGACDCIATQTADLTWDADEGALVSSDLLYGCPPGVLTTICDGSITTGAPKKWNIVIAGFGSPNENLNQSYTITHTTGETWTATKNGVTVTAVRGVSGWSLTITDGAVTVTYDTAMAFCCASITFDIDDDDGTTTPPATLDMDIATACGNGPSYTARLERVSGDCGLCLKFTWVPTAGSDSRVIPWKQVGCGEDADGQTYVEFATDDPLICTGDDGDSCVGNRVVVRLTCICCQSRYGYYGPGYYCVEEECVLIEEEPCEDIGIDAGPFETAEACCLPPSVPCCDPDIELPVQLCASVTAGVAAGFKFAVQRVGGFDLIEDDPIFDSTPLVEECSLAWPSGGDVFYYGRTVTPDGYRVGVAIAISTADCEWRGGAYNIRPEWMECDGEIDSGCSNVGTFQPLDCEDPVFSFGSTSGCGAGPIGIDVTTDEECESEYNPESWNCIPGTGCVEVFDGSGEYPTETDCNADCFGSGGGGGGGSACPGPVSWSFTFSGFTGCLADLNGSHTLAYWFTSGGVKTWYKLVTVGGYTAYIQLSGGTLAGTPYLCMSIVQYNGAIGNQVGTLAFGCAGTIANCCDAATITLSTGYCPGTAPLSTCGCSVPGSVAITPSGACS